MYFIYIIYSASSNKFYVGYSKNPWKRLAEHNSVAHPTFTSKHRPWEMKAIFECSQFESEAIRIERFIKKQKSKKLLEKLCDPCFFPNGNLAQLVRVPDVRD